MSFVQGALFKGLETNYAKGIPPRAGCLETAQILDTFL